MKSQDPSKVTKGIAHASYIKGLTSDQPSERSKAFSRAVNLDPNNPKYTKALREQK